MQMKLNVKKLTALFFAVLMLTTVLTVPASAVWGQFTSWTKNVTVYQKKSKEVKFKFKGDGIDYLNVAAEGYDTDGDPAEVVRASFVSKKMKWKPAGQVCTGVLKLEGVQKGNAIVTVRMYNNNGEYLGDAAIKTMTVCVK